MGFVVLASPRRGNPARESCIKWFESRLVVPTGKRHSACRVDFPRAASRWTTVTCGSSQEQLSNRLAASYTDWPAESIVDRAGVIQTETPEERRGQVAAGDGV